jgi:hypothetical protein
LRKGIIVARLQAVSVRLFGPAPAKDAPKVERFEWQRRMYVRLLPINLLAYAAVVTTIDMFDIASLLIGATIVIWLLGWLSLALQIRRLRRSEPIP